MFWDFSAFLPSNCSVFDVINGTMGFFSVTDRSLISREGYWNWVMSHHLGKLSASNSVLRIAFLSSGSRSVKICSWSSPIFRNKEFFNISFISLSKSNFSNCGIMSSIDCNNFLNRDILRSAGLSWRNILHEQINISNMYCVSSFSNNIIS